MKPYIVVIYWRCFVWSLTAKANKPTDLFGLLAEFGDESPSMKVMPA